MNSIIECTKIVIIFFTMCTSNIVGLFKWFLLFIKLICDLAVSWVLEIFSMVTRRPKNVKGEVVVITGGAGAIGHHVGIIFATMGAKVVLLDVNKESVENAAHDIEEKTGFCMSFACDCTKLEAVKNVAHQIHRHKDLGQVDILVCCAGVLVPKSIVDLTVAEITRSFEVNVFSIFWVVQSFLPTMLKKNKGYIVAISSIAGHFGQSYSSAYSSSKFAIRGLIESLQWELHDMKDCRVKTSAIYPYFTQTPLLSTCSPSSRFFDNLSIEYTATKIVHAILYEYEEMFIPSFMSAFCVLIKITSPGRVKAVWRKFFNVAYYTEEKNKK